MKKTTIGFLKKGDIFYYAGRAYKLGSLIRNTYGYCACSDAETHKIYRFYIDTSVEVKDDGEQ